MSSIGGAPIGRTHHVIKVSSNLPACIFHKLTIMSLTLSDHASVIRAKLVEIKDTSQIAHSLLSDSSLTTRLWRGHPDILIQKDYYCSSCALNP